MIRFVTRAAMYFAATIAFADNASSAEPPCPPQTSVTVSHTNKGSLLLRITATNTCPCQIAFRACTEERKGCNSILIKPASTGVLTVTADAPDGKAKYDWRCKPGR